MTKTENLQLPQWAAEDPIRREDFNAAFAAVEAAMAGGLKLQSGTYTGKGTYGSSNPNSLSFDFAPNLVVIVNPHNGLFTILTQGIVKAVFWGSTMNYVGENSSNMTTSYAKADVSWSNGGATVSWYTYYAAWQQYNESGTTYHYFAIG